MFLPTVEKDVIPHLGTVKQRTLESFEMSSLRNKSTDGIGVF